MRVYIVLHKHGADESLEVVNLCTSEEAAYQEYVAVQHKIMDQAGVPYGPEIVPWEWYLDSTDRPDLALIVPHDVGDRGAALRNLYLKLLSENPIEGFDSQADTICTPPRSTNPVLLEQMSDRGVRSGSGGEFQATIIEFENVSLVRREQ